MKTQFYSAISKDPEIVKQSSSGGAFSSIVRVWFQEHSNASVSGCVMDNSLHAIHVFGESIEECEKMRGSKYIMSKLGNTYPEIKKRLTNQEFVLFSGTPCQVFGLLKYLEKNSINITRLLTIEVICHGVAETKFFEDYISHLENIYKSKAISCNFRAKHKPGVIQDMQVCFENGKMYTAPSTRYDWFYSLYNNNNNSIRNACFSCKFAKQERYADLSLGDSWERMYGRSLIAVNTEKGMDVFRKLHRYMEIEETSITPKSHQTFFHPTPKPENYDEFWNIYNDKGFLAAQKYMGNNTIKGKIIFFIASMVDRLGIKQVMKRFLYR